jgi:hypothetical protein
MTHDTATQRVEATVDRRRHDRIAGPFDAVRLGALETAVRIFDLSRGGCFVNALHEQKPGVRFKMRIDLPQAGEITLTVETLYQRSGFGFAVRFVDLDTETLARLDQVVDDLQEPARSDPPAATDRDRSLLTSEGIILPFGSSLWDAYPGTWFQEAHAEPRSARAADTAAHRARAERLPMVGAGYRAVIDGQTVALINLSLTGAQVRGPVHAPKNRPTILQIGWPQDKVSCSAIARVRWIEVESETPAGSTYRMGLAFEEWDVRRLKEIMQHCTRTFQPRQATNDPW